jgi:tetratricopeptide (TPR) repeat protein
VEDELVRVTYRPSGDAGDCGLVNCDDDLALRENQSPCFGPTGRRKRMTLRSIRNGIGIFAATLAAALTLSTVSYAQRGGRGGPPGEASVSPEEAYYNSWNHERDPQKKAKLGEQFVRTYPTSRHDQEVYDQLVLAYDAKQDWSNFYAASDKAIAQYPDDVTVLALTGWVIPHLYSADDPDADKKLDKAEVYDKHALEVIPKLVKAPDAKQEEFVSIQKAMLTMAYSGLGLVYFRKTNYQDSVKELQQATQTASTPDPIDFYALGAGLEHLSRYSEAADAYQKCSQIPGNLQTPCKDSAERMRSEATAAK